MSEYVWSPSPAQVERANVTRLMRRHGLRDYHELVARSQSDVEWFWDAVVRDLDIAFFRSYDRVLDDSRGIEWARWFTGGTLNLTHNCVDRHAATRGAAAALLWEGEDGARRRLSYAELRAEVDRVAHGLRRLGVRAGDRVALYLPMTPEATIAAYATAKIGAIFVPIFSGFAAPAVAARLNDAGAKLLLTADGFLRRGRILPMKEAADAAAAASPTVERTVVLRRFPETACPMGARDLSWDEAFPPSGPCEAEALDSETPFMIAYTSGTSGKPKGSVHVHGGFLVKVAAEAAYQTDVGPDDVLYWVTDMGWIMGIWEMVGAHAAGACVLMYEGAPDYPKPDRLWALCEAHKVSVFGLSPTLIRGLIAHGEEPVQAHDLSRLRILGSTGEPWNDEAYLWYARVVGGGRCPIVNMCGGTEVGACFFGQPPVIPTKVSSLGPPGLGMAMEVLDAAGAPLRGELGELACTKPWPAMTRGFWNDSERYLAAYWSRIPGIWVHGDWAIVDGDGYWRVTGRSDDTMNVAGKRIGPSEIEAAAVKHPAVVECAAIGMPDAVKGTAIWCFCVPSAGTERNPATAEAIRRAMGEELGRAFTPSVVRFVDELPKTRSAKVLRRAIRAMALGEPVGDLSTLENPRALDAIEAALRSR
jgi:acetyl-CoA synthetase